MKQFIFALLVGMSITQSSVASSNASVDSVIKSSFKNVSEVIPKHLILTSTEFKEVRAKAKASVDTKVYRYYLIRSKSHTIGKAVLITRKVRAKKATILYAFDKKGTLRFSEIMAFGEPPEYIPSQTWMNQLDNQKPSTPLMLGKDIPTISGSTLSAQSVVDGARIARAVYAIRLKK
ncbi:MAG: hypothetical protein U9O64_00235 [Campylobacterota bacterium]|nr:hypothetical protein [Campylobacterota bacterium]